MVRTSKEWKAMETWDIAGGLEQPDYIAYHSAYCEFMGNPDNEGDCEHCPHGLDGYRPRPCGQQNCWVTIHCKEGC